ncbi:MAG: M14 family metallopeptidase [Thermoplasmatota archaeon]
MGSRYTTFVTSVMLLAVIFPMLPPGAEGQEAGSWSYHTSYEICSLSEQWASDHGDTARYTTARDLLGTREIPGGRDIPIVIMDLLPEDEDPWALFIGAHHGDEPDSAEAVLAFLYYLLNTEDERTGSILGDLNIVLMPVVNPFGLDTGERNDENGEDPNRDYPFAPEGITSSSDGIPLTTAGAQAVHSISEMFPFSIAISFHTGSEGVFTPWGAEQVSNLTPDQNMFRDLGAALSRASGTGMQYGPANDFGSLGYIRGAFDDHLYGSGIKNELLDSQDHMLPYSTATATVEMVERKGRSPWGLGSLEGVETAGAPEDGTVAMGVRMCLAACELASPTISGKPLTDGFRVSIRGAASISDISAYLEDNGAPAPPSSSSTVIHPFLPETEMTFRWDEDLSSSNLTFRTRIDEDWGEPEKGSDPVTAPVSLLSSSRRGRGGELEWRFSVPTEPEREEEEGPVIEILDIEPGAQEAGGASSASINIPVDVGTPIVMVITAVVEGEETATAFSSKDIETGIHSYEFLTPIIEGEAAITANLTTDKGSFLARGDMLLYPHVYIMNVLTEPLHTGEDRYKVLIGVDGGRSDTTIFYGLCRSLSTPWSDQGWSMGPVGVVSREYGPYTLELDMSMYSGSLFLRVCNFPGGVETHAEFELETSFHISDMPVRTIDDELIVGPGLILMDRDGLEEVRSGPLVPSFRIQNERTGSNSTYSMVWTTMNSFTDEEWDLVLDQAAILGADPSDITGAWWSRRPVPLEEGTYRITINVTGELALSGSDGAIKVSMEKVIQAPLVVGGDEEEEKNRPFPWALFLFVLLVVLLILGLSILRRNAHTRTREEGRREDPGKAPPSGRSGARLQFK